MHERRTNVLVQKCGMLATGGFMRGRSSLKKYLSKGDNTWYDTISAYHAST